MEQIFAFIAEWWWIAPATAAFGAIGYSAVTTGRRRARRLELDAARLDEREARGALATAKARVRAAQADVLAARAQRTAAPGVATTSAARQALHAAKQAERSAALAVRASHQRVKAAQTRYYTTTSKGPLPLTEVMAEHDAVTARWMDYETDAAKAIAFPQLLDARHPATFAFLRAHQEAQRLRPGSVDARLTPAEFSAYRRAVHGAAIAFDAAERDAHAIARGEPSPSETAAARASAVAALSEVATALGDVAVTVPERLRTIRWRELLGSGATGRSADPTAAPARAPAPPPPAPRSPSAAPPPPFTPPAPPPAPPADGLRTRPAPSSTGSPPVWPVPARTTNPPAEH